MVASVLESGETILVSNVYAPIDIRGKIQLWAYIRYVRSCAPFLPWILAGDFNVVLSMKEKQGGLPRLGPASDLFWTNVDSLALVDVKPSNEIFTWNNRRSGPEAILIVSLSLSLGLEATWSFALRFLTSVALIIGLLSF